MNFTKKTIKPLDEVKKTNKAFKLAKYSLYFVLLTLVIAGITQVYDFVTVRSFRSPVVLQVPWTLLREKTPNLISPTGTKSAGLVKQAYAEELKNPYDIESPKGIAWEKVKNSFGIEEWDSFETLIQKESSWNPYSINDSSGACSLVQALPCAKLPCELWDYACQIDWGISYIEDRYSTPTKAVIFHLEHNYY